MTAANPERNIAMAHEPPVSAGEKPRSEPEIMPPSPHRSRGDKVWTSVDERGTYRLYVTRLGPFSVAILLLGAVVLTVLLLVFLIGTFVVSFWLAALLLAASVIAGWWRRTIRHQGRR
jgi:hypothetical protein